MKALSLRLAAFVLYVVSFFLPAIQMDSSGPGSGPVEGWSCAVVASILTPAGLVRSLGHTLDPKELLVPLSGLVNWLFLGVCVLSFWRRLRRSRLVLGALMLPCFAATWIFLATSQTKPLAGLFAWIAACGLLLIPDAVDAVRANARAAGAAPDEAGGQAASR